jgi:hypothetical protein
MALSTVAAGYNRLVAAVSRRRKHEAADELHVLVVPSGLQANDTEDAADDAGRPAEGLQLLPRNADCGGSHCDFYYFAGGRRQKDSVDVEGQPQLLHPNVIHFNFFEG